MDSPILSAMGGGSPAAVPPAAPAASSSMPTPPAAPAVPSAPKAAPAPAPTPQAGNGMTLEQLGQSIKKQYPQASQYSQYGDAFLGMVAASKNPQYKSQLDPTQVTRIPPNIDQHVAMFKQAIADQNPAPAAPSDQGANADIPTNLGAGIIKSGIGTVAGAAKIGMNLANTLAKIPGLGWLGTDSNSASAKSVQAAQDFSKPSNEVQAVGKVGGDIAQFFIPGGAEKTAAEGINGLVDSLDMTKIAEQLGPKAPDVIKGILKIAGAGGVSASSMAGVTALQTGGDKSQVEQAGAMGFAGGALSKSLEMAAPALGKALQKADFKLSPTQSAKAAKVADDASTFMTDNKILGSESTKYRQLNDLTGNLEDALQKSVPDLNVKKGNIIDEINSGVESLRKSDPAVYQAARNTGDEAIKTLQGDGQATIKTEDALTGKRSWGKAAFGMNTYKTATKDPRVASEGAYAVELAYQKAFSDSLDRVGGKIQIPTELQSYFGGQSEVGINEFNKTYSSAINAKNLTFMAQKKLDTGLMGRLFGLWAGRAIGESIMPGLGGEIGGATIGEMATTRAPGMIRQGLEKAAAGQGLPGAAAKAMQQAPKVIQAGSDQ